MAQVSEHHGTGLKRDAGEFAARVLRAFLECDDEVRKIVVDMLEIMSSPDADEDEREAATLTFQEALFPEGDFGDPGIDLASEPSARADDRHLLEKMDAEEHTFSERLASIMTAKGMDQTQLAARAGVGQPAISMMLSRACRPQRRTIDKLAKALGVKPSELWPE
jgi:lambda repressor-like predicted transcriptional regulator